MQQFSSSSAEDLRPSEVHFEWLTWLYVEVQFSIFSLQYYYSHTHTFICFSVSHNTLHISLSLSLLSILVQLSFDC